MIWCVGTFAISGAMLASNVRLTSNALLCTAHTVYDLVCCLACVGWKCMPISPLRQSWWPTCDVVHHSCQCIWDRPIPVLVSIGRGWRWCLHSDTVRYMYLYITGEWNKCSPFYIYFYFCTNSNKKMYKNIWIWRAHSMHFKEVRWLHHLKWKRFLQDFVLLFVWVRKSRNNYWRIIS